MKASVFGLTLGSLTGLSCGWLCINGRYTDGGLLLAMVSMVVWFIIEDFNVDTKAARDQQAEREADSYQT
jgi:hypothetical protein